ncbi:MAG TPA: zinc-dependent dehydrogenase [Candidatus Angelobacter sp.]|nr:zinc-dependent dehydrogenase [Candidatus Angelobacter sp.]
MATATQTGSTALGKIPAIMRAAVYHGQNDVRLETVPVPTIGPGELLIRVHTCGICGTDLKKISTGSHSAPRIFGHETSGMIVAVGEGGNSYSLGERVMVFHHIPCRDCFYCNRKVFAQCPVYKKVGVTAGYEPSGGGFAEYVRVMDWIVQRGGVVRIPQNVSYEQAAFIEPVNTCQKGIEILRLQPEETVLVIGQGPIGMILAKLALSAGTRVFASDMYAQRLEVARNFGITETIDASKEDATKRIREVTDGRGADAVIVAVAGNALVQVALDATRPGGRVLLFAQTTRSQATIDPSAVCMDEKFLLGSYSASVDLQKESERFVFSGDMDMSRLVTHRFPLEQAVEGIKMAMHPQPDSLKIVITPGMNWEGKTNQGGKP